MANKAQEAKQITNKTKTQWWSVILSVFAAAFGVQSNKNRENDFSQSSIWPYIVAGLVFAFVLVVAVFALAKWVSTLA